MINGIKKETIVSTTEDRLTLLNWLKKLEKTLSDDTLTDIAFTDDNGNVSLVLTFEDGTTKSVAFPYDMGAFESKEESSNKILPYKNLSLNDFDKNEGGDYFLKSHLSDGIYRISFGSNNDFILHLYGRINDDEYIDLGHHYLLIHQNQFTDLHLDGFEDGLVYFKFGTRWLPYFEYLDDSSGEHYVYLIVTNGIVILTNHIEM